MRDNGNKRQWQGETKAKRSAEAGGDRSNERQK